MSGVIKTKPEFQAWIADHPWCWAILKKQCRWIGVDPESVKFWSPDWYTSFTWTKAQEDGFREWLLDLLQVSVLARRELLATPRLKSKKRLQRAVAEWLLMWSWRYKQEDGEDGDGVKEKVDSVGDKKRRVLHGQGQTSGYDTRQVPGRRAGTPESVRQDHGQAGQPAQDSGQDAQVSAVPYERVAMERLPALETL